MHRRIVRSVFILLCGGVATALGVAAATLFTAPGRRLLARFISDKSSGLVRGSLHIGAIRGGWFTGFSLDSVVIRDTAGALLLSAPHLDVRYQLANLLAGRVVLAGARVQRPEIQLIKHKSGRLNYEEIFRLGEGPAGASPLLEIHDLEITDGRLTIRLPWNPDGRLRSARQVDSALAYERSKPGRRIEPGPEGLELIRTITELNAKLPLLRISTPDRQPVMLEIAQLAARVSDPALDIRELSGTLQTKGDSLLFEFERVVLPGTSGHAGGRLDWPQDTIRFHFNFDAPRVALADLRFISPKFPDFTGSGRVRANSLSNTRTEYDIREMALGDASSKVTGRMVAITDVHRGLGFRGLGVALSNLDLDVVRPYLDTLPFYGRISGRLRADGFFDQLSVSLDWAFQDANAPGAESLLALDGRLRLGGAEGMFFQNARLNKGDFDLRTVRLVAPAVILEGRLGLAGTLNGPLKNVVFQGNVEHRDAERRPSRLNGTVRLDTRGAMLGLETDVVLDSLAFDGIRRSFPQLKTRGALGGSVKLAGFLDNLRVDATVGGGLGRVEAHGRATLQPPRWGADSLRLRFQGLDLAALLGSGPATSLQGTLDATGVVDSATAPVGRLDFRLGPGRIREFALDSAAGVLRARDSMIALDTLRVFWQGGQIDGGGTLGWASPRTGRMLFHVEALDLAAFDSLALGLTGFARDTVALDAPMRGRGRADIVVQGTLGTLQVEATAVLDSLRWLAYRAKGVAGRLAWRQEASAIEGDLTADSLWRRQLIFTKLSGQVRGRSDSLSWAAAGSSKDVADLRAGGRFQEIPGGKLLHADSLNLALLGRTWRLGGPLNARLSDSLIALDTVRFVTSDGSGSIELAGELPRNGPGELTVTALGVELRDIYGVTQRDTAGIAGVLALDGRLSGTARTPEMRGTATVTGPAFGDFHAPLIRAAFDYRQQLLRGNLTFWRTGRPVLEANLSVPLDLALQQVPRRQLPGPLDIDVRGDSIDLAITEAFTPNLRLVSGLLNVDARVQGTWESPRLAGQAQVIAGAASVPGLGVRYRSINGTLRLAQDSILTEGLRIETLHGDLVLGGGIRLERLTSPVLNLSLAARDFDLIDVSNYLSLRSSGDVRLTGTLEHPVLTGSGRLSNSVIYFADLFQKDIVNLEDPLFADLVDTLALRKYSLGANFQSRFLDSLSVRDLQFEIGEAVWLRSSEANFQLEGRLRVNKTRHLYRIDGDLDTPRGTYTLNIGNLINRTFTVERGTVRYFGDLNAELDVEARHIVRTPQQNSEDIPVIAHITGTLLVPKISLATPPDRPPMSEPQLISLLMLGTTDVFAPTSPGSGTSQLGLLALGFNALSSELQRAIISDLGFHAVDIIEIRPGLATSGFVGGATGTPTQLAVGRAISSKLFVTANAGFCFSSGELFSPRNLGATLEYRFRRSLRAQLSAEPVQTCLLTGLNIFGTTRRYQFGAELRWDRDY